LSNQAGKLDLNWVQTTGSALAALSSAVLLSTLGAAGTLVGAAVGSIVVTVGGTVYSHYLSVSRARMSAARSAALVRASRVTARSGSTSTDGSMAAVTRAIAASPERFPLLSASATGSTTMSMPRATAPVTASSGAPGRRLIDGNLPGESTSLRQLLRGTRWKKALAASLGVFVLVMGVIVSMELATGRALSSFTGGSSADGPRTSFALLGSTSDTDSGDSTTTDPAEGDKGGDGSGDTSAGSGAQSTSGSNGGSSASSEPDTDAPQPDTSTADPDAGTPTQPAPEPTPGTPSEPAPEPSPAPTTQAPAKTPAPTTGAAVGGAAADTVS